PDGSLHRMTMLVPDKRCYSVFAGESLEAPVLVVAHSLPQGACDASCKVFRHNGWRGYRQLDAFLRAPGHGAGERTGVNQSGTLAFARATEPIGRTLSRCHSPAHKGEGNCRACFDRVSRE